MSQLIGLAVTGVEREVTVSGDGRRSERLDLLLTDGEGASVAIEVKLVSDLGRDQLPRYLAAFPQARAHLVLHLGQLPFSLPAPWRSLSWEDVLDAHTRSQHPWVAATAVAWRDQLHVLVPHVDADTVWNSLPDDPGGFELALRARVAWLYAQMSHWCRIEHRLAISSGGGAWVATMRTPAQGSDHWVIAEVQEGLASRAWGPDHARPYADRVKGPIVLVGLAQYESTSSAFDWSLLHRMFREHVLDDAGNPIDARPWQTTAASIRNPQDRANWQRIIDEGAPRWLGKGYGMTTAKTHAVCAFGARLGLPPTMTLGAIDYQLQELQTLVTALAAAAPGPTRPSAQPRP